MWVWSDPRRIDFLHNVASFFDHRLEDGAEAAGKHCDLVHVEEAAVEAAGNRSPVHGCSAQAAEGKSVVVGDIIQVVEGGPSGGADGHLHSVGQAEGVQEPTSALHLVRSLPHYTEEGVVVVEALAEDEAAEAAQGRYFPDDAKDYSCCTSEVSPRAAGLTAYIQ